MRRSSSGQQGSLARMFLVGACALLVVASQAPRRGFASTGTDLGSLQVLFVGNSYTRFNMLPQLVQRLGDSARAPLRIRSQGVTRAGYTLRMHWKKRYALREIKEGDYTHVVLQPHSLEAVNHPGELDKYLGRFTRQVAAAGAQPILYETWARRPGAPLFRRHAWLRSASEMRRRVSRAYRRAALGLGARLSPVGTAFEIARERVADIVLHHRDGSHPTWAGTFLAACVLYGSLSQRNPQHTSYVPWQLDAGDAERLRRVAREALGKPLMLR